MEDFEFDRPVEVQISPGRVTAIKQASVAIRHLLDQWPEGLRQDRKHRAAREALLSGLQGGDTVAARKAYEAAAREAGLLVSEASNRMARQKDIFARLRDSMARDMRVKRAKRGE